MSRRWILGLMSIFLTMILTGCAPPPEAVLEGAWKLTPDDDTGLSETLLTFDQKGKLSAITFKLDALTITYDKVLCTKTTVDGAAVTIDTTFLASSLIFNGTLNSDQTIIAGTVTMRIQISSLNISIDEGSATLTKQ